jgi:two-component system, sporulation sensor kinase C
LQTARRRPKSNAPALRDSEDRFHLLAEHAQDVIYRYRIAPSRGFEYVNPAITSLTGYTPEEHYADPDLGFKLVHPEDREALEAQLQPDSAGGLLTVRWIRKDGQVVWTEQHNVPIYDAEGNLAAIEGIARDVTDRKRSEAVLTSLQDEFISSISHDLRTPLAAIKASVGVVLANEPTGISEPLHRMLVAIDSAADDLSEMVANLLELARLQAHGGELRRDWLDLRVLARRAIGSIEPMAKRKRQIIEARLPGSPLWGFCDGTRVERAICNLLGNARKYAEVDTTIRLTLARRGGEAVFSVADEGPGIAHSDQERIFERVYNPADKNAARSVGSGLGLPIVRAVAEVHGGRLWLESEPGRGAIFSMAFPLRTRGQARDGSRHDVGRERAGSATLQ